MRLAPTQTVYPCEEHGEVAVPLRELVQDGELDIYPEIAGRGYFNIDYRRGALVLKAARFVGLIPISDRVAIHVKPKVPIGNLLWMVWRAGAQIPGLEGVIRGYQDRPGEIDSPEALYSDAFITALATIARRGLLKRYRSRETDSEWRGRLAVAASVRRFYAQGIRYRHVFNVTELASDNLENRILKHTAVRVLAYLDRDVSREGVERARRARVNLQLLTAIDDSAVYPELVARKVPGLLRSLPAVHAHYESALWLSYLIATRSAVTMEQIGRARFESLIVETSDVFEEYVRAVCVEGRVNPLRCRVLDGNKRPLRLFIQGTPIPVKPDMYFLRDRRTLLVADAKYKSFPSREDRFEVLAHCEASGARRACFVCPTIPGETRSAYVGTTPSGIRFDVVRINLSSMDMVAEEADFLNALAGYIDAAEAGQES